MTMTQEPGGATICVLKLPSALACVRAANAVLGLTTYTGKEPGMAPEAPRTSVNPFSSQVSEILEKSGVSPAWGQV